MALWRSLVRRSRMDHAVRACYAALAMQAAVKQYAAEVQRSHGVPVQIRVGLHAGEVVVRSRASPHLSTSLSSSVRVAFGGACRRWQRRVLDALHQALEQAGG